MPLRSLLRASGTPLSYSGLVWVVVEVPFVAGAALAFVLNLPEKPFTPAASPERPERTLPTTPSEKTTPSTTLEITATATATAASTVSP